MPNSKGGISMLIHHTKVDHGVMPPNWNFASLSYKDAYLDKHAIMYKLKCDFKANPILVMAKRDTMLRLKSYFVTITVILDICVEDTSSLQKFNLDWTKKYLITTIV